ncbi:GNAT family N-acetyltransferase [Actinomycetospora cinnamomea]|uniref:Acetyltransferase (GNAT) family protein n=1 Tax=Actinomycetospora cinnamomea TaxID=663609 RepID=A0A2U1FLU6_9PSEU|nr:GNAT family N-acetyltransferase [Actinomycetospora cinnamomea]PVZ13092.1 acetyltransferase (GNAT) family protein [Actinomycetospora cinnamomea]
MTATLTPVHPVGARPTAVTALPGPPRPRPLGRAPTVAVRELGPTDADVLDAVFTGLSDHSRYLRFHGATPRLTGPVRRKLTAVDGRRHLAVAAFAPTGEPVGIARLIWLGLRDAELAVEVVDAWQGRGVGRRLLHAIAARGREEGYARLVAVVLAENTAMQALLASVLPIVAVETDAHEITLTADLRPALAGAA